MLVSTRLLQACRITLFSREQCSLCTQAKAVLSEVCNRRPFEYKEVDLALPDAKPWRQLYDFDIPVIHIARSNCDEEEVGKVGEAVKLMHRFTPAEVEAKMDFVEARKDDNIHRPSR